MAKLADILPIERERHEPEKWNVIHLFKTGTFYSAYEWSAWLTAVISFNDEVRMQTRERQPLAVTRNTIASAEGETFCKVGFPLESVSKYIPQYDTYEEMEDGDLKITITIPNTTTTTEELTAAFEEWKQTQPFKDKSAKSNRQIMSGDQKPAVLARSGLFQIVSELLSYPIEQKTPAENVEFLSNMKQKIVALL